MAQASPFHQHRGVRTVFWWGAISGLILVVLNGAVVLLAASSVQPSADYLDLSLSLNLGLLGHEDLGTLYVQYLLLFGLVTFLVGLVRGWVSGKGDPTLLIGLAGSLFGGVLAFAVLPLVLSQVIGGEMVRSLLVVLAVSPVLIGLQGILATLIGGGGGLVGSHFLHKRRMMQESALQQERGLGANFWVLVIPGILLVVLNTAFVLLEVVRSNVLYCSLILHLDLGILETEDQTALYLQYLLPCLLVFLLIGVMRGRATRKGRSALFASIRACLSAGALSFLVLPLVLSLAIGGEIGLSFVLVIAASPVLIGLQLVLAALGGGGGGRIGGRWLGRSHGPDQAMPTAIPIFRR